MFFLKQEIKNITHTINEQLPTPIAINALDNTNKINGCIKQYLYLLNTNIHQDTNPTTPISARMFTIPPCDISTLSPIPNKGLLAKSPNVSKILTNRGMAESPPIPYHEPSDVASITVIAISNLRPKYDDGSIMPVIKA